MITSDRGVYVRELSKVIPGHDLEQMTPEEYAAEYDSFDLIWDEYNSSPSITPAKVAEAIKKFVVA